MFEGKIFLYHSFVRLHAIDCLDSTLVYIRKCQVINYSRTESPLTDFVSCYIYPINLTLLHYVCDNLIQFLELYLMHEMI